NGSSRPPRVLSPAQRPKISSAPLPKRPVPAASLAKAKNAFKSFSLSKYASNAMPANQVAAGQSPTIVQRRIISQHIKKLGNAEAPARAMTIALPAATIKQLLPSFNPKTGTIDLNDVMSL